MPKARKKKFSDSMFTNFPLFLIQACSFTFHVFVCLPKMEG